MFIVFEGMDGAGKSTQLRALAARLAARGVDVVATREPGGSPTAEILRKIVVEGEVGSMDAETEMLVFTAARRDHVRHTIRPALERGALVLCDRFVDSTYALQCAGGVDAGTIADLHARFIGLDPDLVVFLMLDEEEALARATSRGGAAAAEERFERKGIAFHRRVADNLRARAALPGRVVVDGKGTIEEVADRIDAALADHLAPFLARATAP